MVLSTASTPKPLKASLVRSPLSSVVIPKSPISRRESAVKLPFTITFSRIERSMSLGEMSRSNLSNKLAKSPVLSDCKMSVIVSSGMSMLKYVLRMLLILSKSLNAKLASMLPYSIYIMLSTANRRSSLP